MNQTKDPMELARQRASQYAQEVRLREVPCDCRACVIERNLAAVQRIVAAARERQS